MSSAKITMPNMEYSFEVSIIGEKSGQLYQGKFLYKRPNLGLIRQIRCQRARLNEDLKNLDEETVLLNEMLSWMQYTLLEVPAWWDLGGWNLFDYNVVSEIYTKILEFENSFRQKVEDIGKQESSLEKDDSKTK